jgi:CheY-like chemotaxis protein
MEAASASSLEILVVDDQEVILLLLEDVLTGAGFRVETRDDGALGLARAREHPPAAILLDVRMPGMDGWEVLAALKGDPRTQSVPVIITSASLDPSYPRRARAAGAHFLAKPFAWRDLVALVEDVAGGRPALAG